MTDKGPGATDLLSSVGNAAISFLFPLAGTPGELTNVYLPVRSFLVGLHAKFGQTTLCFLSSSLTLDVFVFAAVW